MVRLENSIIVVHFYFPYLLIQICYIIYSIYIHIYICGLVFHCTFLIYLNNLIRGIEIIAMCSAEKDSVSAYVQGQGAIQGRRSER